MHWIKKKRASNSIIAQSKHFNHNQHSKHAVKLTESFLHWIGSLIKNGLVGLGVILGTLFGAYLTINYSDRFKSEEALRSFAFLNAYQAYKSRMDECNKVRNQAVNDAAIVYSTNVLIEKYLDNAASFMKQPLNGIALSQVKAFIEPYNEATNGLASAWIGIRECERQVTNAGNDLATVLNITSQYQSLLSNIEKGKPPQVRVGGENIIANLLADPSLLAKLADAFSNAEDGLGGRGVSAFAKIRSLQKKSIPISKKTLDLYGKHVAFGLQAEKETSQLFLTEFRRRFSEKPDISLKSIWQDIVGATSDINSITTTSSSN